MRIGGFLKFSLIDYPGKRAAVIFTQGCNFRCPYCHNPELVRPELFNDFIPEAEVVGFLKGRQGKLEGVVITGGEPTLQGDLLDFMNAIKCLGFLIKLDSNGTRPEILQRVIQEGLADYIAMDIKSSPEHYSDVAGVKVDWDRLSASISLLKEGRIPYEFRTTACKPVCQPRDLEMIKKLVSGCPNYRLQQFIPGSGVLDPSICEYPQYTSEEFLRLQAMMAFEN